MLVLVASRDGNTKMPHQSNVVESMYMCNTHTHTR